ncbi:MAG: AAA family ATPase [Alphaproteobacteria bacterium]
MIVEDQSETVAFLSSPAAFGAGVGAVERIDTHISVVFLAGMRAYKLKRAVRYDYVDFSTLELRRTACEAEVRINRRTAPDLYIGVLAVTRAADDALVLGGDGPVVDWLVEMVRFDRDGLFDRLAQRGALTAPLMREVADEALALHAAAEPRRDKGGRAGMAWVVRGNAADLAARAGEPFDDAEVAHYTALAEAALARHGDLLDRRRRDGFVRLCHGDLHLRNICLVGGRPTLFDAIEFNDDIACCDVLYDVAFLVMDLLRRGLRPLANLVLNRYLAMSGDAAGLALFGFFLSCRAAVRAKTTAISAAAQSDRGEAARLRAEAARYLDDACAYLTPSRPRLVAIGGLSGSGKSTLAAALAPALGAPPGAVVLRSDVLRKRLFGLDPCAPLGVEGYAEEVTGEVYGRIEATAGDALRAGFTVVADAVYARPAQRARIAAVAAESGAPFTGLWLEAPAERLAARLGGRGADASDADEAVLELQLALDVGAVEWRRLDASDPAEDVCRRAEAVLAGED